MNKIIKAHIIKFNLIIFLWLPFTHSNTLPEIDELKLKVLEKFHANSSFKLIVDHPQKKIEADLKILNIKSDTLKSKIFINMLEPKQFNNMSIWIWNYKNKTSKTWLTGPLNGKVKQLTEKKLLPFKIPLNEVINSVFDGIAEISHIDKFLERDVYQINVYGFRKNKKFGPIKKILIDTLTKNILKIDNLSKKGKLITEVRVIEYQNDFPKIVSVYESKGKISYEIKILDYVRDLDFIDFSVFEPKDLDD